LNVKTAIVVEGGGQRGIYAAGILDAFLAESFMPFDLGVGVSAGAQNLLAYFLEQRGYARRAIMELTKRRDFLVPHRCLTSGNILDLDGYFDSSVNDPEYRLPYNEIASMVKNRRLIVVATDNDSLEPVYLELNPDPSTALDYVKASSAVPFLYRHGVDVDGHVLVDGGVADPTPISHAYKQGARRIVLVRTALTQTTGEFDTPWSSLLRYTRHLPIKPERLKKMMNKHEQALLDTRKFMDEPPKDLQMHIIAPRVALKSRVFASAENHLREDYEQGYMNGVEAISQLADLANHEPAGVRRSEADRSLKL